MNISHMKTNIDRIKSGLKPLNCHPKSQCSACVEPQDTFTPSNFGPLGMPDPDKYPDFKPAPFPYLGGANPAVR